MLIISTSEIYGVRLSTFLAQFTAQDIFVDILILTYIIFR